MTDLFWSNTAPYLMLLLTSIVTLVFTLKKSMHRRFTIAFTAATLDFLFYIEAVLLIVINAYAYHPGLSADPFQDSLLGNLFSQFSIATTSALLLVYKLPYVWYFFAGAVYFFIDVMFVRLGIYTHFHYRSLYTLIGFPPLLMLIKYWRRCLVRSGNKILHGVTLLFGTNAIMSLSYMLPLMLTGIHSLSIGYFENAIKNQAAANIIYGLIVPPLMIAVLMAKPRWSVKVLLVGGVLLFNYVLYLTGIAITRPGWFLPVTLVEIALRYFLIIRFDRYLKLKPAISRA